MPGGALQGLTVVVTRPAAQAQSLTDRLAHAGASVRQFPALQIAPPRQPAVQRQRLLAAWAAADIVLFVSANAVRGALTLLNTTALPTDGPLLGGVGPATVRALERAGGRVDLAPADGFDSESLLVLPALRDDMRGRTILIVRGDGGRELLARTLRQRGAMVRCVQVYRRLCPGADPADVDRVWLQQPVPDLVTVTSPRILQNLLGMLGEPGVRRRLLHTRVVAVSRRMVKKLAAAGFCQPPLIAENASDEAVVDCIVRWHQQRHGDSS